MPRVYSPNETHTNNWVQTPFLLGVAEVPAGEDTSFFSSAGYTIDQSKHSREVWDELEVPKIDKLITYFGGTPNSANKKHEKIRALETLISAKFIASVTTASAAATTGVGKTKITITTPGTSTYYFKSAAETSPDLLFGDVPDDTWQALVLETGVADEVVPNDAADTKYSVVRVTALGTVSAISKGNLTVKAE